MPSLPPLCPPSERENRGVFSVTENWVAQGRFPGGNRPAFAFPSSLVGFMGKKQWVESHRSDSTKLSNFTCSHRLLKEGVEDLDRDKGGSGNEPEGVVEAPCDSAPPAWIMQIAATCRQSQTERHFCGLFFTTATNGPRTCPMSQTSLLCSHCTQAVLILSRTHKL